MSKTSVALKIIELVLDYGLKLLRAVRKGDDRRVDEVLRKQPRIDEEWAKYELAKESKFE